MKPKANKSISIRNMGKPTPHIPVPNKTECTFRSPNSFLNGPTGFYNIPCRNILVSSFLNIEVRSTCRRMESRIRAMALGIRWLLPKTIWLRQYQMLPVCHVCRNQTFTTLTDVHTSKNSCVGPAGRKGGKTTLVQVYWTPT
jgi:hypothetical protein